MLKIAVADSAQSENPSVRNFDIEEQKDGWHIAGELFDGDIARLGDSGSSNRFHVIWKNKSYNIEVLEVNQAEKTAKLLINGTPYYTSAKNRLDLLLEGMGMQNNASQKLNNVKAPMPGLIQSVSVSEGEQISKGDSLLVLVAMKMENVIKSPGNGVIKSLKVASREIVEKNQVLLEFQ
ncbi:acetyl-CoA carboxylase biotin carboxyl carrier protein subunit [Dyadobacter luticola]|uniref:Acetyl-CoA carboxylase biotin carboxyl carrier protein subunit n=1 Tax=Dyadobacter luticola TaxID=1979387 RepID=A0A5R9KRY5_9BACT|nr:acetyl-CoA carboxylase biotin carboxyl carrier protein subunit [Dyadobacter luticola]TLU98980.1 acetyl-CoA carboxylase biotin carboxyl carrier protein subunit [Dyadobacter luticola]